MPARRPIPGHNDYFHILERHLESGQFELFACGEGAPSVEEIEAFAVESEVRLPDDFIDFSVSRIGGLYVAVKEEFWPRPKPFDVGPFWSFLYGLYVYGFSHDIPDYMNIRTQTPIFRSQSETNLIPCIKIIGDANIYGFDPEGILLRWDHETGECDRVENTFIEAFEFEVGALAARRVKKLEERGRNNSFPTTS